MAPSAPVVGMGRTRRPPGVASRSARHRRLPCRAGRPGEGRTPRPAGGCSTIRAAIRAGHVDTGADDPTGHDGVRRVLQGLTVSPSGGPGPQIPASTRPIRSPQLIADVRRPIAIGVAIMATAVWQHGNGKPAQAHRARHGIGSGRSRPGRHRSGDCRRAVPGWLAQVGSGGAALGGRAGRGGRARHRGLRPPVENRSGRHRGGRALRQEWLRQPRFASLRDRLTVQRSRVAPGWHRARCSAASTASRLHGASPRRASAAGIEGRITGHSGRVGLAVELTRRGAPEQATAKAGGWKSSRMVAHYAAAVAAEQGAVRYLPVAAGAAPALRALQCRYRIVSGFRGSVELAVRTLGERSQSAAQLLMVWHPVSGP